MNWEIHRVVDKLKSSFERPISSETEMMKLSPMNRPIRDKARARAKNPKNSAVLICLYPKENETHVVLMERNSYKGVHSKQISFPGGRTEKEDLHHFDTAKREAHEELGIDREATSFLGELSELYIPPSNFLVYPFVVFSNQTLEFEPDEREVKQVLEVPLSILFNDKIIKRGMVKAGLNQLKIEVPYYDFQGHVIWGATAMMIAELKAIYLSK